MITKKDYWILFVCWATMVIAFFLKSKNSEDVSLDCKIYYPKDEKLVIICRGECDDVVLKGDKFQCKNFKKLHNKQEKS